MMANVKSAGLYMTTYTFTMPFDQTVKLSLLLDYVLHMFVNCNFLENKIIT